MTIPRPSHALVKKYAIKFDHGDYALTDAPIFDAVARHPINRNVRYVLMKVALINALYRTGILDTLRVAKHIAALNIDPHLRRGDPGIVNDIANVRFSRRKIYFYSFASKYCSFHCPDDYPIYDSFVRWVILRLKQQDRFARFTSADLLDYPTFKNILVQLRIFYDLTDVPFKRLDKCLWLHGKNYWK